LQLAKKDTATDWKIMVNEASCIVPPPLRSRCPPRTALQSDDAGSSRVSITVLSVTPAHAGKLFALASVEVDIDGVQIAIHGIRALRVDPAGTRIEVPKFRDGNGVWRTAIALPEEVRGAMGNIVLDTRIERGLAVRRPRVDVGGRITSTYGKFLTTSRARRVQPGEIRRTARWAATTFSSINAARNASER
jgi:stage V sporulation protein G